MWNERGYCFVERRLIKVSSDLAKKTTTIKHYYLPVEILRPLSKGDAA